MVLCGMVWCWALQYSVVWCSALWRAVQPVPITRVVWCSLASPATRDEDFKIPRNATLRFMRVNENPPILSSVNPVVYIEEDGIVEGTEAFLCVLAISVSPGQPLQSSDPDTITITILDIDGKG